MKKTISISILMLIIFSTNAQIVNRFRDSTWFKKGVQFDKEFTMTKDAEQGKVLVSEANGLAKWKDLRKVDTIYRNLDSIVYKINGLRYAIFNSVGANTDSQSLYRIFRNDSIEMGITRGNTITFAYAVDSISISGDSLITFKGGVRRSYSIGTYTLTKPSSRDSFILSRNGIRLSAVPDSIGSGGGGSGWALTGNSGTDSTLNFIGTTDAKPLSIRTNNNTVVKIDTAGKIGVGNTAPISTLHISGSRASNISNIFTLAPKLSNLKFNTSFDMTDSSLYIGLNSYFNKTGAWSAAQPVASYIRASSTGLMFSVSSGNTINGAYTNSAQTKSISLFANGNVTVGGEVDWGYKLNSNCTRNGFDGFFVQNTSSGSAAKTGIMLYNGNANLSSLIYKAGASFATTADRNATIIETAEAEGIKLHAISSSGNIRFFQFNTEIFRVHSNGNVGIGTATPDASAILDVSSTTKGLALPTMTAAQASAISNPKKSLMIYVTDTNGTFTSAGWWGFNGTIWKLILAE